MLKTDALLQKRNLIKELTFLLLAIGFFIILQNSAHASDDPLVFDDTMLEDELVYPDWFKVHTDDLKMSLEEAKKSGKKGIIVYYGQARCAYCLQFFKYDLGNTEIVSYLRRHFEVIPIDIWGIEDITDTDGTVYSERELAEHYKATFTPTVIFYNLKGEAVFGLRGFYPPYKFRASLEYVVEQFYLDESFSEYLARAEPGLFFSMGGLTERDFFLEPPYSLANLSKIDKPVVVFFEQGNCHACDLLHSGPLNKDAAIKEIQKMQAIQVNTWSKNTIELFNGEKISVRDWARQLKIFHSPTLVFFEPGGKEIIRIDSIVQFYRLQGVLDYVNRKGYLTEKDYQMWRLKQRDM